MTNVIKEFFRPTRRKSKGAINREAEGSASVYVGGNANNGSNDGCLYWNVNNAVSNANVNIGGRSTLSCRIGIIEVPSPEIGESPHTKYQGGRCVLKRIGGLFFNNIDYSKSTVIDVIVNVKMSVPSFVSLLRLVLSEVTKWEPFSRFVFNTFSKHGVVGVL